MKKKLYSKIPALILLACTVVFSSCLKDDRYVDFGASKPIIEIPLSGLSNFTKDAITDAKDTIVKQFAVNIASPATLDNDLTVSLGVDNAVITAYNASDKSVEYLQMPAGSYVFTDTKVTIPKGTRTKIVSVTFYKSKLDPSKSYMLPIKITDGGGQTISGNFSVKYYHFIGNDFAGTYKHQFTRTPAAGNFTYAAGNTSTFLPDSPTQFEVAGGYFTGTVRYLVTFTKTGSGATALYSDFAIVINPTDVTDILGANSISVTVQPVIIGYDPSKSYTFTEAQALFDNGFRYSVLGGSGARVNLDQYKK